MGTHLQLYATTTVIQKNIYIHNVYLDLGHLFMTMFHYIYFYTYIDPICIWVAAQFTINLRIDTKETHV